jgi:drug/metabolite transporter (DMT)-like permease
MQFIPSGISGLVNLSLIPIGLFSLSILVGNERAHWRHAVALVLGTAGLVLLFSNKASLSGNVAVVPPAASPGFTPPRDGHFINAGASGRLCRQRFDSMIRHQIAPAT